MKLEQGDAFEIMAQMPDKSVDCVLTDPPMGMMPRLLPEFLRVASGSVCIIAPMEWPDEPAVMNYLDPPHEVSFLWHASIYEVWAETGKYGWGGGLVLVWRPPRAYRPDERLLGLYPVSNEMLGIHLGMKPASLSATILDRIKPQSVFDPFMGTGSVCRAAMELGIDAHGVDIEQKYVDLARTWCDRGKA